MTELLIAGRERLYLQTIFQQRLFEPSAIDESALATQASADATAGAMRAASELYRAFDRDVADNREALRTKRQTGRFRSSPSAAPQARLAR